MDLALNNLQRLICHKIQQIKPNRHKERDAQSFYTGFFICPPPIWCDTCPRLPRASESQPFSSGDQFSTLLTNLFKISQNPLRASGA